MADNEDASVPSPVANEVENGENENVASETAKNNGLTKSRSRSRSSSSSRSRSHRRSGSRHHSSKRRHHRRRSHSKSRSRTHSRSLSRKRSHRRRSPSVSSESRSRSRSRSRGRRRRTRRHSRSRSRSRSPGYRRGPRSRYLGPRDCPPPSRCLGVFGMNINTTESTLAHYFQPFGKIEKIQIIYDAKSGRSRGFGFVYFDNAQEAVEAKEQTNGLEIDGYRIRVDFSLTQRAHTPTPGIYMGKPMGRDDYYGSRRYGRSPSPAYRRRSRSRSYS